MASLQIIDQNRRVFRQEIGPNGATLGGGAGAQTTSADADNACCISRSGRGFAVRKLNSAATLMVNGQAVSEAELQHADVIDTGAVKAVFCVADEEPALPPLSLHNLSHPPGLTKLQLTWLHKLTWFLTRLGRARRALARALDIPDAEDRVKGADRSARLLLREVRGKNPEISRTLEDLLVFLCWHATTRGNLKLAQQWLDHLLKTCPNADRRLALRSDLAKASLQASDLDGFVKHAKALAADKATTPEIWAATVVDMVGRAYVRVSPACAREIIASANARIKAHPQVDAMLAVCECAAGFASADDAQKKVTRIRPEMVTVWRVIRADACLAQAVAAEWVGDVKKMLERGIEALQAAPSYPAALYWLARARLHFPEGNPAEHLGGSWPEGKPEWQRLRLATELHQRPHLVSAEPVAPILEGLRSSQDTPEQKLLVTLLERALRGKEQVEPRDLAAAAGICRVIQAKSGKLPWTEVHLARHETLVERRYADACKRLECREVAQEPGAADCATVARILGGNELPNRGKSSLKSLLTILASLDCLQGKSHSVSGWQLAELRNDPICERFPSLRAVVDAVALMLRVMGGDARAEDAAFAACCPNEATEPWVRWLYTRALLLVQRGNIEAQFGASLSAQHPYVAWDAELWACNRRQSRERILAFTTPISAVLDQWTAAAPKERDVCAQLRRARLANYASEEAPLDLHLPASVFPELGERWDTLSREDVRYELEYSAARRTLATKDPDEAARLFRKMDSRLSDAGGILRVWWQPLIQYWLGVAQARAGAEEEAVETLRSLLGAPFDSEARSQLALIELRAGRTDQAEQWLPQEDVDCPGVRYARTLVAARRGQLETVREQLDSSAGRQLLEGSSYDLPARRLLAATEERLGHEEAAEHLREELLAAQPQDEITLARQGRRKLKVAYQRLAAGALDNESVKSLEIVLAPVKQVAWRRTHSLLRALLTAKGEALSGLSASVPNVNWLQLIMHQLLSQGHPEAAFKLATEVGFVSEPERAQRTQAILSAWHVLVHCHQLQTPDQGVSKTLAECAERLKGTTQVDDVLARWRQLLATAHQIAADPDGKQYFRPWSDLSSPLFDHVPGLWAEEAEIRRQSAAALVSGLEHDTGTFQEAQALLLKALAAWENGDDEAFLEKYGYLEPVLEELPAGGPQLWVAAALIHFARKDWPALLESQLPDCVADLENEDVRLLIGMAYARVATEEFLKGDIRNALQDLRKAQDNLGVLIGAAGTCAA